MIPCEFPDDLYSPEIRMIVLLDGENRMIVASAFIRLDKTPECDGNPDRQTDGGTDSGTDTTVAYTAVNIASYTDAL